MVMKEGIKNSPQKSVSSKLLQASSLVDFTKLVEREGTTVIHATPVQEKDVSTKTIIFSTEITSETPKGGKIVYKEFHEKMPDVRPGVNSEKDMPKIILKGIVTAEDRLDKIKEGLPGVTTLGPTTKMNETTYERMQEDVKTLKITPFPSRKD